MADGAHIKDYVGNVPVCIIRFVLFAPMGIYQALATNHWNVIKNHSELQSGIYGTRWATGEILAHKWATFGFYWNFAVWIPAFIAPAPFSMIFGILDTVIAVMISISTSFQTSYSPHNISRCRSTGAHDWQLPPGANESFFDASARLNATATNSFHMCKSYVLEWQYGIVISFFYTMISVINIFACCWACVRYYRDPQRNNKSFAKWLWETAILSLKLIALFFWAILYLTPVYFFRCLPIKIKAKTRYARRYTAKTGLRAVDATEVQLEKLVKKMPIKKREVGVRYKGGVPGNPANLADFLGIYDVLMLVVEDLHYADILNLSLTSKRVRESVLPAEDYDRRLKHFRMYTCESKSKTQCWVCVNQICNNCSYDHTIKLTTPYHHLDGCNPSCTPCYKSLHASRGILKAAPFCRCAPPTPSPNVLQRMLMGSKYYVDKQVNLKTKTRAVCKQCAFLAAEDVLKIRAKRTEYELRLKRKERGKCGRCAVQLGAGPRWWLCGVCNLECRAVCHNAWGRKEKGVTDEVLVGEEAV